MFKIFLFLIFAATQSFAGAAGDSNYITDFGIYVYGDVQAIQNAFILVQTIAQSAMLPWILAMIGAFFLPYSAYDYFKTQDFTKFAANLTFMSVSFLALDTANLGVTVHIEDLRAETSTAGLPAKTYAVVDDIPYPIALVTSTVSTIVDGIKREFEDAIQVVNVTNGLDINGMNDEGVGFMSGLGDVLKITKMASFSLDSNLSEFGRATQAYINDCVIAEAVTVNPNLIHVLKTPSEDIFSAIKPSNLGFTSSDPKITYDSNETSCSDFYNNNISANYSTAAQELMAKLNKNTVGDLTSTNYTNGLRSVGAEIPASFIASDVGKFQAYGMNVAALATVSNAFRNYLTDVNSGQDVANTITAGASIADLQSEGAGKFKWMAEIIPMGFHYMLGVIYSISILIMIVATALGYQKGMMVWKNFAKGLLTFEFIKIALVIVNSTVNQYAASHAADFLASVGQNPASISSLPYYINYIASMTGIAGMLGIASIFMIPGMVFSGEVAMAAGAIGGLASKYKGNDIQTATSVSAQQKSQNAAWENELRDQARLDHMGVSVPQGMGATQFYSEYQKGAQMANAGYGAARMGTSAMDSAGHAVKGQTMQNISSMSTLDHNATMDDFVSAGVGQGAMMAGDVTGTAHAVDSYGSSAVDKIKAGKSAMTAKSIGNTVGYGEEVDNDAAIAFGELGGKTMGAADKGTYEGAVAGGIDNFLKGTEDQAAKKSSTTANYGKTTSMKSAIDAGKFTGIEIGAADNELAADPNIEGDAITSGKKGIDKKLQSIHGAQKAQIYNKDGSDGKEHDKFMLGGTDLERRALNNKELAMGLAMNKKSEEEKRQMYADMQADGALKTLDEFSKVKGARKTGSFTHDKDGYLETASNENNVTWKDTNGKTHSMSRAKANELLGDSEQRGIVGKGAGIFSKTDGGRNMDVLANNAMGMEAGNISGTSAAIDTAGGVKAFAALKGVQSSIQTAESSGASKSKVEEGLIKGGMGKEDAKKLADAIVNGSTEGADKFKKALESLSDVAGAKAGGQTRADMTSMKIADGPEGFKQLQADSARIKTDSLIGTTKGDINKLNNDSFYQNLINKHREGMTPGSAVYNKATKELENIGFLDSKGNLNTNKDERFQGLMQSTKGNMAGMHGITIGSSSYSVSGGVGSGSSDIRISKDTSTTDKSGKSLSVDDATKISTGIQIKGTTLDPAAWAEVTGKMISKHGFQAVKGAISDAKNGNFDNFRKFAKDTFGNENGNEIANNLQAQWQQDPKTGSDRLGEFLLTGSATYGAYKIDKKFNPELDVEGKKTGRGKFFGKIQDGGRSIKESVLSTSSTIESEQSANKSDNGQPNKTNQEKTNDLHNNSFNKDIPNDTTSGKKVNSNLDFENMSVDGEEIITKQPAPHMSNVKGSTLLNRFIKGAGEVAGKVAGPLAAGYEINQGYQDVTSGRKGVAQSVADTGNRIINDYSLGFTDPVREAIKGDMQPLQNHLTSPTDTISRGMSYIAAAAMMPFSDNSFSQNQQAVYSSLKAPSFNSHKSPTGHSIVPPAPQQNTTGSGGSSDDVFNQSPFMNNLQSRIEMGSYQSLKAGQTASRTVGIAEEMSENMEYTNDYFQEQLSDVMDSISELNDRTL